MAQCTKALVYVKFVLEEWVGLFISCGRLSLYGATFIIYVTIQREMVLRYVPSKENVADIFTKVLDRKSFLYK